MTNRLDISKKCITSLANENTKWTKLKNKHNKFNKKIYCFYC